MMSGQSLPFRLSKNYHLLRKIDITDIEDRSPPAVGAYWIKEEDYAALLSIFSDGNKMPPTWKDCLKIAEEMKRGLEAYGHVVMRVYIDPNTFPEWCATNGWNLGAKGRKKIHRNGCNRKIRRSKLSDFGSSAQPARAIAQFVSIDTCDIWLWLSLCSGWLPSRRQLNG